MNKNRFLNLLFFILNGANLIFIVLNFIYGFLNLYYVLALFLFLNSIYLFLKFVAYYSDSSLFFGVMFFFCGVLLLLTPKFDLSFMQLSSLILLSFTLACLFIAIFFNSIYFLYTFISNFLIFFPINFYSFHLIDLNLLFIFVSSCVIINVILYLLLIKSVRRTWLWANLV